MAITAIFMSITAAVIAEICVGPGQTFLNLCLT